MSTPPSGPFRIEKASGGKRLLPDGVTEWDLRSPRYRRLFPGVFVAASVPVSPRVLAQGAVLMAGPTAVISHHTAARLWGGIVPDDGHTHLTVTRRRHQVRGLKTHRAKPGQRARTLDGLRLTTPDQTFLDLAAGLTLVDLVVLGDSLVRAGRATPAGLVGAGATYRGSNRRVAARAAGMVRPGVDSPMESRLRMLIVLAGLPQPVINHKIHWPDGRVRFRFDLSYPEHRLVIEYDGRQHAESDAQWDWDIDRREWMDTHGWRVVIVRSKDLYGTPARTLSRIMSSMRDMGMPVPALSEEWRFHFPSKAGDLAFPV